MTGVYINWFSCVLTISRALPAEKIGGGASHPLNVTDVGGVGGEEMREGHSKDLRNVMYTHIVNHIYICMVCIIYTLYFTNIFIYIYIQIHILCIQLVNEGCKFLNQQSSLEPESLAGTLQGMDSEDGGEPSFKRSKWWQ